MCTIYLAKIRRQLLLMRGVAENQTKKSKTTMKILNSETCNLLQMDHDENSMHKAIVQQVHGISSTKNKSKFNRLVQEFRSNVAKHIEKNFNDYVTAITQTIYSADTTDLKMVTSSDCLNYLNDKLKLPSTMGGVETLKAASELFEVNILNFSPDSIGYSFYNEKYNRTILLANRNSTLKSTRNEPERTFIHYDSVFGFNEDFIENQLLEKGKKKHSIKKMLTSVMKINLNNFFLINRNSSFLGTHSQYTRTRNKWKNSRLYCR